MGPLLSAALNFLRADNWPVTVLDGEDTLQVYFQGEKGNWMCYAQAREDLSQFVFYSICPLAVPPARRAAVGEFVNRANFGLVIGNFEFDYGDGEIRYKTSLDSEGDVPSDKWLRTLIYANVSTVDRYLAALMSLVFGGETPERAVAAAEID